MRTQVVLDDDKMTVAYTADLTSLADKAKAMSSAGDVGTKDMKLAMEVHDFHVYAYMNKRGITYDQFWQDPQHLKNLLNDPDNADFRIWKGRV
ncbi:hypothetical protein FHW69_001597 [Luteibacter sp. Sphag1AF]|uniref:hypothetical protein n=1 Tax=Luteibacter sp. Sphag1AF TaxID=2587031 RepID=UPI0016118B84|nr:hypothetical protein [Luteibacter sp. Sphag1AF]MBB3226996.1 hypothetical protein [Luteibacter sp. Sphag1AF]